MTTVAADDAMLVSTKNMDDIVEVIHMGCKKPSSDERAEWGIHLPPQDSRARFVAGGRCGKMRAGNSGRPP
jgi:hypothetical protein